MTDLKDILDNAAYNLPQDKWQEWAKLALAEIRQLQAALDKHVVNNFVSIDRIHGLQDALLKHRWIPVAERLPKESEEDDVIFVDDKLVEAGEFKNGLFWDNRGRDFNNVTHWMPIYLPKPKEQE